MNPKNKGKVLSSPGIKTSISVSISLYKVTDYRHEVMSHIKKRGGKTHTYTLPREKANQQPIKDMTKILKQSDSVFKITILKTLMRKMNTIQD